MMKQFFKHKSEVKVRKHEDIKEYLFTSTVQSTGATSYDSESRLVNAQNNESYAIFKVEYINPNGVDRETDSENARGVNELIKALTQPFKIVDMNVVKNGLSKNIELLRKILERKDITSNRREKIEDRLDVMNFYNEEKYVTTYMYISLLDIDIFCKIATNVFNIERLNEKKTLETLYALNNDME